MPPSFFAGQNVLFPPPCQPRPGNRGALVIIAGRTQQEHDYNLSKFLEMLKRYKMTLNFDKCKMNTKILRVLGYEISNNSMKPDPTRLDPIKNLAIPSDKKSLQRMMGLFSYYARCVPKFSEKVAPLVKAEFPLNANCIKHIEILKNDIMNSILYVIDDTAPLRLEKDASDTAIGSVLSQSGKPIAFFSRSLNPSERKHSPVEKEAYCIVESVLCWRHSLLGRHFLLLTDQKAVSFMYDQKHSKIKNKKIQRWRLELMPFSYEIQHRSGELNVAADALSRPVCASTNFDLRYLEVLH